NVTLDKASNWALVVHSSAEETAYTMTLTAPEGYIITGYDLTAQIWSDSYSNSYSLTAANGTTVTINSTTLQTLSVSGLSAASTDISIVAAEASSTTQRWLTMKTLTVSMEPTFQAVNVTYELYESDCTTLVTSSVVEQEVNSEVAVPASFTSNTYYDYVTDGSIGDADCTIKVTRTLKNGIVYPISNLSNNKAYKIVVPRGTYTTNGGYLANTVKNNNYAINNFAFISYEDNIYMWSIEDSKFAGDGLNLSETPHAITFDANTTPSYLIKSGSLTLNASNGLTYGGSFDSWSTADDGNRCVIYEVEDFDPTDALAALDAYFHPSVSVTYVISDENGVVFTSEAIATSVGETITALPSNLQRPFCSYSEINQTMVAGENTVNVTVTYDLPFEVGTDKLYYATLRGHYVYYSADNSDVRTNQSSKENTDAYKWSFEGNPYDGIKVKNAASGTYLTNTASTVQLTEDGFAWTIDRLNDTSTFGLKNGSNYINEQNHSNHNLIYWTQFTNDTGSQWNVEEVPEGEALYEEVIAQLEAINFGTGLGQYGLVIEEIDYTSQAAAIISSLKAKGYTEENLTMAEQMLASYSLNMPSAGFYRIKGKTSSKYLAAGFAANNKFAMTDATDGTTVFYFDGSHLVNLSSG
ncbi:MAG: hypothetical protein IJS48_00955, partial [Prevotella sp.]|nr:hypothetical protein [Prevotella sp.]